MLYNFKLIEFYKDLQQFVSDNLLRGSADLQRINHLMVDQHKLDALKIDFDLLERVRNDCELLVTDRKAAVSRQLAQLGDLRIKNFKPQNRHLVCFYGSPDCNANLEQELQIENSQQL